MFCQYCGYNLRARARFCNKCGKPVKERFGSALLHQPPPSGTTDEIPKRGTGRQPTTPSTAEDKIIPSPAKPSRPPAFEPDPAQQYHEVVFIPPPTIIDQPPPQPPTKRSLPPLPPLVKPAPAAPITKVAGSTTDQLQNQAAAKPFFTQLLSSNPNQQHKRLVIAVPLLLLAIIFVFVFAYIASK
jgi:hypothetical protein